MRKKEQENGRGRSDTDRSQKMAVSETDQSQVCLKVEDLQSDPGQGDVGQKERTSVVEVRNRDISGRSRQGEGEGVGRG